MKYLLELDLLDCLLQFHTYTVSFRLQTVYSQDAANIGVQY